ncbi:autotransporter domain-containing protein [Paraburkholderia tuberum]|uniref:autotransporter domain-containing protein n=1 Tax=Paraburkholderia tuberum TaxID=157910 RepID=UPI001EF9794E|nr:autotransporter outer membrane beta-barrel domain-containing protein [Paraburkholderia tuberum]
MPLGPGFVLEPQMQVIWQHVGLNEANDGLGPVDPGSTSGVTGRLGLWTIERAGGDVWQPYVRTNLWRDWGLRQRRHTPAPSRCHSDSSSRVWTSPQA